MLKGFANNLFITEQLRSVSGRYIIAESRHFRQFVFGKKRLQIPVRSKAQPERRDSIRQAQPFCCRRLQTFGPCHQNRGRGQIRCMAMIFVPSDCLTSTSVMPAFDALSTTPFPATISPFLSMTTERPAPSSRRLCSIVSDARLLRFRTLRLSNRRSELFNCIIAWYEGTG